MVRARKSAVRYDLAGKRSKAPLHPVPDNCIADLAGHGETDAHLTVLVASVADEKDEPRSGGPPSGVGREKVRAFPDYREAV
jgi:hypothetical protein